MLKTPKKYVTTTLKAIPHEFQKSRWAKFIAAQGEYFESDPSQ